MQFMPSKRDFEKTPDKARYKEGNNRPLFPIIFLSVNCFIDN